VESDSEPIGQGEVFPEIPPRVEYELTSLGKSLLRPMQTLVNWVATNWEQVKKRSAASMQANLAGDQSIREYSILATGSPCTPYA
jgi:hypothetical protein